MAQAMGTASFENLGNPMKRRKAPSSENGQGAKTPWGGKTTWMDLLEILLKVAVLEGAAP